MPNNKYTNIKNLLLGILLGLLLISCDTEDDLSHYYWDQTKCSDPWNTGENDANEITREAVTTFLKTNGISMERDEDKMEELGFYR